MVFGHKRFKSGDEYPSLNGEGQEALVSLLRRFVGTERPTYAA